MSTHIEDYDLAVLCNDGNLKIYHRGKQIGFIQRFTLVADASNQPVFVFDFKATPEVEVRVDENAKLAVKTSSLAIVRVAGVENGMHQDTRDILQFFAYEHLPEHLQTMSKPFGETARKLAALRQGDVTHEQELIQAHQAASLFSVLTSLIDSTTPANKQATRAVVKIEEASKRFLDVNGPESLVMEDVLQILLEAKDCAVRSLLFKSQKPIEEVV